MYILTLSVLYSNCGNSLAPSGLLITPNTNLPNTTCQMRCRGAEPEICGGPGALSVYNNTLYVPPVEVNHVGKYGTKSCILDPNTLGRPLQGNFTSGPDMTVEKCIKFCLGSFYRYAGYVSANLVVGRWLLIRITGLSTLPSVIVGTS